MYLNCHSYFSLKYGTIPPDDLLDIFIKAGVSSFALTDINNTSTILDILRKSADKPIKIIPGIDFRNGAKQQFIGLAKNNEGLYELNAFLSYHLHTGIDIPDTAPTFEHAFVIYPYGKKQPNQLLANEFVGLRPSEYSKLIFTDWKHHTHLMVILQPVTFRNKRDFNAHRILRAIDNNTLLSRMPKTEEASPDEVFVPETMLENIFAAYPHIIYNTKALLAACYVCFEFNAENSHNNQQSYTANQALDYRLIRMLCAKGLSYRYPQADKMVTDRIEMELQTIKEKGFVTYFLIAWKILKYARAQNYFYVGRGSGANSIVAYILRITDVDPIELDLYFERFINLFRKSPPDFDIDFSWKDREDVTAYIFRTFKHVTLLGAYSTFQNRSVIREIAKVFGLPDHEIDKLQKKPQHLDQIGTLILQYSEVIHGFPSHITVHAAGIIISQLPIYHYTATFMPPKGFATTHFDMHTAEDIMLYKFDILGQRGLAKIKDAVAIIKQNRGIEVDIHNISLFKSDKASNDLLKKGMAIGCFYVESPAMRMLLKKLEVCDYLGLVAASSVIRPGVAQSGMMREYILRHRNPERRAYAQKTFPTLYELMPETYGVMVYQEDVIKVAHYFAGLSLAEADVLRRGMSGKYRSRQEFQEVKDKFFQNCANKGITSADALDVWNQIESFAGYAFAKGHSASYAVESYQCLYLKTWFPLEFLVATINNGGGFYSTELYLHEARLHGATVHLPCINISNQVAVIQDKNIYLGLGMIHSLSEATLFALLNERNRAGAFTSLNDVIHRVSISLEQLVILIRAGVFRFTGKSKKELLWQAHFLLSKTQKTTPQPTLFETKSREFTLPLLWAHDLEDAYDEIELIGFLITQSPFSLVTELPLAPARAALLPFYVQQEVTLVGYMVHVKPTKTKSGKRMYFGTFLDLNGEWIDTVVFPPTVIKFPFSGPGCYLLHGKVTDEFGFCSLEIIWQKRLPNRNIDDTTSTRLKVPTSTPISLT